MLESKSGSVVDFLHTFKQNPLFWFLEKGQAEQIQHSLITKEVFSGRLTLFTETLAADSRKKLNEDSYLVLPFGVNRLLFAVLDGASSQKEIEGLATHGITGAFYISHMVGLGFENSPEYLCLSRKKNLTAADIMRSINSWIFQNVRKVPGVDYRNVLTVPGMAATFLLVDLNDNKISIAHVADTIASALYLDGRIEILTPNQNEKFDQETLNFARELSVENGCSLGQVQKTPELSAKIKQQLRESFCRKINTPNGCGILNGMPELIENNLIYEREIPISEGLGYIFLLSDGALIPYMKSGVDLITALEKLISTVYNRRGESTLGSGSLELEKDPEFDSIPRLKYKDDATILIVGFNN